MVGKYVDIGDYKLADSYISVNQALEHAGAAHEVGIDISWIDSKELEKGRKKLDQLEEYHGILIPGGFGGSGVEGKVNAIRYAREQRIPFLGLCYGMQWAVVEFARNMCGLNGANSTEVDPETMYPVIDILPAQREIIASRQYGASMRLGAYAAVLHPGSRVLGLYRQSSRLREDAAKIMQLKQNPKEHFRLGIIHKGERAVLERHRHRYEVSPPFIEILEKNGLCFSGHHLCEDGTRLMEFLELPDHPFFVATQAHPEFKSRLVRPAPLFSGFVEAAAARA
jgi:CTP synthase